MSSGGTRSWSSSFALDAVFGGLLLFVLDAAFVLGRGLRDFLTPGEVQTYLVTSLVTSLALVGLVSLVGAALHLLGPRTRMLGAHADATLGGLLTGGVALPIAWSLTSGRRIAESPVRWALVFVLVLVAASAVTLVARKLPLRSRAMAAGSLAGAALVAALDVFVLVRLYPAFHAALTVACVLACALFGHALGARMRDGALPRIERSDARSRLALAVLVASLVASPILVRGLGRAPNASFVVESRSPTLGEVVALAARTNVAPSMDVAITELADESVENARGIDLRDGDILLITVDALRADRLRAYGGEGLTPHMDALAAEGVVFAHAYTPTPHTSYALGSMLTGKYLRPLFELPEPPTDHVALPELLRRYGYRTAAFYPPAIFFVDAQRFASLAENGFGFEYRKEMFAPAASRVTQVSSYLDDAPVDRPVFVWVHLFEPHEPYAPPESYASDDSPEARYDGEVRAADEAIGGLVSAFRARRPNATVIVGADHGEEFGDHGGQFHGSTLYEEQVHIPLVWSSPGHVTHHIVEAPVELVDLATTILAAAGIPRDARMRGDDLGPLLAGTSERGPPFAFADIADARMVVDGRFKAICRSASNECQLFDLRADAGEQRNVASMQPAALSRLRAALSSFVGSVPAVEAMALRDAAGFPPALARAELGDPTAADELTTLLGDARIPVRARAAAALARLHATGAEPVLRRVATSDADASVRGEASVAVLALGGRDMADGVAALLGDATQSSELRRRAAFALAAAHDARAVDALLAFALDPGLGEDTRRAAIEAVGALEDESAAPRLAVLLEDVRLRGDAAKALGRIHSLASVPALLEAFANERYASAREHEARALFALGDRRVVRGLRRYLGMESGIPNGVALLLEHGEFARPRPDARDLRNATLASMDCDATGCRPFGALLPVGPARGPMRLVVRVRSAAGVMLRIGESTFGPLPDGTSEVSMVCQGASCASPVVDASGEARIVAFVLVPAAPEIPAPAAVPWDAGVPDAGPGTSPSR